MGATFLLTQVAMCATFRVMKRKSTLKKWRKEKQLTLLNLAEKCAVNKSTVLRWERHGVPLDRVPQVERMCGAPRHVLRPDYFSVPVSS
jgi:DNA-binding XRE family transcriptional regulator